ncbi:MAG TPA: hypothetical protein VIK10_11055 [Prolixibacteraceae bacterium]
MTNLKNASLKIFKSGYLGGPELRTNVVVAPMLPNVGEEPKEQTPDYFNQRNQIENFPGLLPNDFSIGLSELTARRVHSADRYVVPPMFAAGIDPNTCFDCD